MMIPRFLVPDDATSAASASVEKRVADGLTQGARVIVRESMQAALLPRKKLFAEAMLEDSLTRPPRHARDFVVSATVQLLLLGTLLLLPLYFTQAIDVHQLNKTLLVAPPPAPGPQPPPPSTRSLTPRRSRVSLAAKLVVSRVIPNHVPLPSGEPRGADLTAAIVTGDGVPGGQPGGVIGGTLSGPPPPPPPIDSAPKSPIRVGHGVKAPRLIFGPDPVYPVLARQAKISGAVVIDAVIDTQGNVIEMRTVSGPLILALAAMETLRHWKYEPTVLGGEAVPVRLLVTIDFVQQGPRV